LLLSLCPPHHHLAPLLLLLLLLSWLAQQACMCLCTLDQQLCLLPLLSLLLLCRC
jgi:hypothetical protein